LQSREKSEDEDASGLTVNEPHDVESSLSIEDPDPDEVRFERLQREKEKKLLGLEIELGRWGGNVK
jgi:hypothetical protein